MNSTMISTFSYYPSVLNKDGSIVIVVALVVINESEIVLSEARSRLLVGRKPEKRLRIFDRPCLPKNSCGRGCSG